MLKTILHSFFLAFGFQIVGVIFRSDCQLSLCNSLKAKSLLKKKINLQFSHNETWYLELRLHRKDQIA